MRNVIFVLETPLLQWDIRRFGFNYLCGRGIKPVVFDIGKLTMPLSRSGYSEIVDSSGHKLFQIESIAHFESLLQNYKRDSIVIYMSGYSSLNSLRIMRVLSRSKITWGSLSLNVAGVHFGFLEKSFFGKLLIRLRLMSPGFVVKWFIRKLFLKLLVRKFDFFLLGSPSCEGRMFNVDKNTKLLRLHTFDYDAVLPILANADLKKTKLKKIVYLDGFFPYHPDFLTIGVCYSDLECEDYFLRLNNLFAKVEEEFDCTVVIAAHPRANGWKDYPNAWNGREVVQGETANLVANSIGCLAFSSNAVNFPVIFDVPLVLFNMRVLEPRYGEIIRTIQKRTGAPCVNLDELLYADLPSDLLKINREKYDEYLNNYIKYPYSSSRGIWEIVSNTF